jgi:hypothetical protein
MKYLTIITILSILLAIKTNNELSTIIKAEVQSLAASRPGNFGEFIQSTNSVGDFKFDNFHINELDNKINSYALDQTAKEKFRAIIFAASVTFQSFNVHVYAPYASFSEIIGAARNVNDQIELVFLNSVTTANLIPKYNTVTEKKCHRVALIAKKCHTTSRLVLRGYIAAEIDVIANCLRAVSYEHLNQKLSQLPATTLLTFLEENVSSSTSNKTLSVSQVQDTLSNDYQIDRMVSDFSDDDIVNQVNNQILKIKRSKIVRDFHDIQQIELTSFMHRIINVELQINDRGILDLINNKFNTMIEEYLRNEDEIAVTRIGVQVTNDTFNYYEIILSNDRRSKSYDAFLKSIKVNITLNPKIIFYKDMNDLTYSVYNLTVDGVHTHLDVFMSILERIGGSSN